MRALRRFLQRSSAWARRCGDERRLQAEIEAHLAMQTADNLRAGLSPVEARRQAVLKFGGVEAMREGYRDQKGLPLVETLIQDTRYALRRLRLAPAFTFTTVLTLALGIGATTSIFTLVYAVMLKSLAVANPNELFRLGKEAWCCYSNGYSQDKGFSLVSYDLYKYLRDKTKGFSELAAFSQVEPNFGVRREGVSEVAQGYPGEFVSGNYFAMFGVNAYAGRTLSAKDDVANAPPVVVMSYRLWQQRYGSDPSVIGSVFDLDEKPFTVVGITPPGFFGDQLRNSPPDFFLPLNTEPVIEADADLNKYSLHWLDVIGRIRPGVTPGSLEAGMRVELKQWLRSHWGEMSADDRIKFPEQTLFLRPGGGGITSMRQEYEHWLQILMLAAGFVLLIVCANVANLMLVRGMERRRQTSLSMALGAQVPRLMRQALTESVLLAMVGGAAGLAIAFAGTRLILHFAFPPVSGIAGIPVSASPSMPVLLFAFGVSLITGLAFGVGPAWMTTRVDPIEALRGASRSTARTGSGARKTLVVCQAALSLALLSAAGLLTAALHSLQNQNLGIVLERRIVMNIEPRLAGYGYEQLTPLYRRIRDSLSSIPGISAVALCTYSPQNGNQWGGFVWVDGHPAPGPHEDISASWDRITAGYFEATGNPIIRGRGISEQDTATSRHVAVVNEAFAHKFFKNEDPIGKYFGRIGIGSQRQYEIVGVVKNIRNVKDNLDKPVGPFYFLPEAQHDIAADGGGKEVSPGSHFLHDIVIVTRPGTNFSDAQLRQAIGSIDPNLPVLAIRTLKEQVAVQFTQQNLIARLTSLFGVLSLVLSSIGLYGVTAYNVGRRINEIGVRLALGADRGNIVSLILRGAFALILFGLVIGLPLSFAAGRVLGNQLYGMNPYNPVVTFVAIGALAFAALAASLIPAFRASFISPVEALRVE
jgi:predicted permease